MPRDLRLVVQKVEEVERRKIQGRDKRVKRRREHLRNIGRGKLLIALEGVKRREWIALWGVYLDEPSAGLHVCLLSWMIWNSGWTDSSTHDYLTSAKSRMTNLVVNILCLPQLPLRTTQQDFSDPRLSPIGLYSQTSRFGKPQLKQCSFSLTRSNQHWRGSSTLHIRAVISFTAPLISAHLISFNMGADPPG